MASSLEGLYQQVILDHAREKHGHGLRLGAGESRQYNPLCGDEVTLRVAVGAGGADRTVDDVSWVGEGCSISQASTSVLHDLVVGRPVSQALSVVADFRAMLRSRGEAEPDEDVLGDAVAFAGVSRHANRVKCAILGWTAFEDALLRSGCGDGSGSGSGDGGSVMSEQVAVGTAPDVPADVADVEEALRDVVDPELGINVVDLGLIYGITIDANNHAVIDMTLTSAACPLTDVIEDQATEALTPIVKGHSINWVWMPPWGPDKITDDGRDQLRALGFNL